MNVVRVGGAAAIAGAVLAAVSEVVETIGGGYSDVTFALLIAGRIGLGIAPWGLHRGQAGGRLSALGAVVLSIGQLLFAAVEIVAWGSLTEAEVIARTGLLYWAAVIFFSTGMLLFGTAVLRARHFPLWTGIVFVIGVTAVGVGGALVLTPVISLSNLAIDLAFAVIGVLALRAARDDLPGRSRVDLAR